MESRQSKLNFGKVEKVDSRGYQNEQYESWREFWYCEKSEERGSRKLEKYTFGERGCRDMAHSQCG